MGCYYSVINQVFLQDRTPVAKCSSCVAPRRKRRGELSTQEYDAWGATRRQPFLLSNTVANAVETLALRVHRVNVTRSDSRFLEQNFASLWE